MATIPKAGADSERLDYAYTAGRSVRCTDFGNQFGSFFKNEHTTSIGLQLHSRTHIPEEQSYVHRKSVRERL